MLNFLSKKRKKADLKFLPPQWFKRNSMLFPMNFCLFRKMEAKDFTDRRVMEALSLLPLKFIGKISSFPTSVSLKTKTVMC